MPRSSNRGLFVRSKGPGFDQTYHRGTKLGGAGTTLTLGSKTMREAIGGSREIGVSVGGVSDCVATSMGLLLAVEGEGNRASLLSTRHL